MKDIYNGNSLIVEAYEGMRNDMTEAYRNGRMDKAEVARYMAGRLRGSLDDNLRTLVM